MPADGQLLLTMQAPLTARDTLSAVFTMPIMGRTVAFSTALLPMALSKIWVNTGWNGTGKRISIKDTRGIIDAILDGSILKAETKTIPYFNLTVPTSLPGVNPAILDPRDTYQDASEWNKKAEDLAARFVKNFVKYTGNEAGKALVEAGPKLK